MVEFPYVQVNPSDNLNFLVVDVDSPDAMMNLLHPAVPRPTWIIHKPRTGHAQAGWAIDPVYVGPGHRPAPIRFAQAVLHSLTKLVGGDENFTHFLIQNPAARKPVGEVYWSSRTAPWNLRELKEHMVSYVDPFHDPVLDGPAVSAWQPWPKRQPGARKVRQSRADATGRNCTLFRATLRWVWARWMEEGWEPQEPDALAYAHALNRELERPLPDKEVRELSASACRQARKGNGRPAKASAVGEKNPFLVKLGRAGGKVTTEEKSEAARSNAVIARTVRSVKADVSALKAQAMHSAGETKKAIAEALETSVRNVGRWLTRAAELAGATPEGSVEGAANALPPVASRMSPLDPNFTDDAVQPALPLPDEGPSEPSSVQNPTQKTGGAALTPVPTQPEAEVRASTSKAPLNRQGSGQTVLGRSSTCGPTVSTSTRSAQARLICLGPTEADFQSMSSRSPDVPHGQLPGCGSPCRGPQRCPCGCSDRALASRTIDWVSW